MWKETKAISRFAPEKPTEDPEKFTKARVNEKTGSGASLQLRKVTCKVVAFKDLNVHVRSTNSEESSSGMSSPYSPHIRAFSGKRNSASETNKLVVIMVGLPGRGKSFVCNKLKTYLNWLGHKTAHFNVGQYRRLYKNCCEAQDARFFDPNNVEGATIREAAFHAALTDMLKCLASDTCQVAILDATNSTTERRRNVTTILDMYEYDYLFLESICHDTQVLRQNYLNKMKYSPDYKEADMEKGLEDFMARVQQYEAVYEPIADRELHYIKLTDIITGRGYLDINRISGYIPGKLVSFLMQACSAGLKFTRKIWLTRPAECESNRNSVLSGWDPLTPEGERYTQILPSLLLNQLPKDQEEPFPVSVWTSTCKQTAQTARNLPLPRLRFKVLDDMNFGVFGGMAEDDIAEQHPREVAARKKNELHYRYPGGESYLDIIQRLEPIIMEIERTQDFIVIIAHQAVLRVVYGYLTATKLEDIPKMEIPLHTLIELTPLPDGTMREERLSPDVNVCHPAVCSGPDVVLPALKDCVISEDLPKHLPEMMPRGRCRLQGPTNALC